MARLIIGVALVSALGLAPGAAFAQENPFTSCPETAFRFLGTKPEPVPGHPESTRTRLTGKVVLPCGDMTLFADEVVFDKGTNILEAFGHVLLIEKDLTIYGDRAEFNRVTKLGTFYNAWGFAHLGDKPNQQSLFGTMEPDVQFHGERVAKIGPKSFQLINGGFSTCVQPSQRWEMTSAKGTITLDHSVFMRNVILKVKDVPFFYLPAIYYPINKEGRSTGFLLPQYGSSTIYGPSISNAFFWAIDRSQDATFYHDWHSKTGQGFGSDYRYVASPGSRGNVSFNVQDEHSAVTSTNTTTSSTKGFTFRGDVNQALPRGFRLLGQANYFSQISVQQLYQDISNSSRRDRSISGSLSGSLGRYRLNASFDRQDIFYGLDPGQRTGKAPSLDVSVGDKPIGKSKIYFGGSADASYLVNQVDLAEPTTNRSLWRFDGGPTIRAPLSSLPFLSVTTSASWHLTRWLETLDPSTQLVLPVALTRQLFQFGAEVTGPVLSRVYQTPTNGYAERFKHLIEPAISIAWLSPFHDVDRIVKNDYTDSQVGGTETIAYRLTNRILARRKQPNASPNSPGIVREILSVDIRQTYYTNGLAAASDPNYQTNGAPSTPAGTFTPITIGATVRPVDSASAQFDMYIDPKYRAIQTVAASGSLDSQHARVSARWFKRLVIPGSAAFGTDQASQSLSTTTTVKTKDNRLSATYDFTLDAKLGSFLQQRIMTSYNSQCCGVAVDFQSASLPLLGVPANRTFAVSFTLAGIGSFSNPLGSFGAR
jgi:LPS-assembly protein